LREDLRTRLAWGLVYQLKPLTDAEKVLHLRAEAGRRGLRLSDEVVWYLLNHLPRDLASLHRVLEVLDRYSLASQRAVTLPFVREALSAAQDCANDLDKPGGPE
jgi:DnaA family protein